MGDAIRGNANLEYQSEKGGAAPDAGDSRNADFGNPHVYLDTVVLIGAVSLQFEASTKLYFGLGAAISSFLFFLAWLWREISGPLHGEAKRLVFWILALPSSCLQCRFQC